MVSLRPPPYSDLPPTAVAPPPAPSTSRRSSSVASARSATRRHRHARSHHGGSTSQLAQNEFPIFAHTGDVEIIISNPSGIKENRYVLHRLILSQCSGFFEAGTRAEWNARPGNESSTRLGGGLARINENDSVTAGSSSRASSQERRPSLDLPTRRWHYVLDWETAGDDELPMLVQKDSAPTSIFGGDSYSDRPPPIRSKPPPSNERFFRSVANLASLSLHDRPPPVAQVEEPGDEILKDYDNLFRIMYQHPPSLDAVNIASAYSECKGLLHLADMYDALDICGSRVDHHLLRFGAKLFKQIAKYPPSYLKLAYLARSRTIFAEALVHVVGQWPLAAPQLRGQVDTTVMELLEDKVDELHELQERVEAKLWRLNLTTTRGERVNPANDFLSWLAMSLFRHWLAENTTPPISGILKDTSGASSTAAASTAAHSHRRGSSSTTAAGGGGGGGDHHIASQRIPAPRPSTPNSGRAYRLLGSPDPTGYLAHDDLKRALKAGNAQLGVDLYSRDNLRRLERRVDEIKNLARDAVRPLMRNALELDLRDCVGPLGGLGYLTCTRLDVRDFPWEE